MVECQIKWTIGQNNAKFYHLMEVNAILTYI